MIIRSTLPAEIRRSGEERSAKLFLHLGPAFCSPAVVQIVGQGTAEWGECDITPQQAAATSLKAILLKWGSCYERGATPYATSSTTPTWSPAPAGPMEPRP